MAGAFLFTGSAYASSYTIQPGENLYQIANNYEVGMDKLIASNPTVSNPDDIQAGEMINIPDESGSPYTVTAYTAGEESTGKQPGDPGYGITASGNEVQEDQTLACPPSLSFGTKVHIPELDKTFTCEDRGSAITNGRLDVYIDDLDDALEFGVKELQVQVMD